MYALMLTIGLRQNSVCSEPVLTILHKQALAACDILRFWFRCTLYKATLGGYVNQELSKSLLALTNL